eukprot:1508127-Rhodomonas_salina.2
MIAQRILEERDQRKKARQQQQQQLDVSARGVGLRILSRTLVKMVAFALLGWLAAGLLRVLRGSSRCVAHASAHRCGSLTIFSASRGRALCGQAGLERQRMEEDAREQERAQHVLEQQQQQQMQQQQPAAAAEPMPVLGHCFAFHDYQVGRRSDGVPARVPPSVLNQVLGLSVQGLSVQDTAMRAGSEMACANSRHRQHMRSVSRLASSSRYLQCPLLEPRGMDGR